jgi:uncharacterized protein with PQ loop repeat
MKEILLDFFMTFCQTLNYLFQIFKFNKTKSSKGFSKYLCLVTILSHTLKVFFWFSERFKYALLFQSILVIIMQLYLIYVCIKFKEKEPNYDQIPNENNSSNNTNIKRKIYNWKNIVDFKLIWKWNDTFEYYIFYFIIVILLSVCHICLGNYDYYSFSLGFVSMILDMLGSFPQIIELYKTKNQRNISKIMVLMWFFGNLIKVYYNIHNKSPLPLIIGSYIQVFFNVVLISQIIYYYFNDNIRKSEILMNQTNSNKILFDVNSGDSDSENIKETIIS